MSENVLKVYRSEWKFYISLGEYHYLKGLLSGIMTPDPHMEDKGDYYIRSLYFDSADNTDYVTKVAGIEMRKKIRIRIYNTKADAAKLEIKNRYNQYMLKESLTIDRDVAERLIAGDYGTLDNYSDTVARKAKNIMETGIYTPKTVVDYEREAFVYPEHNVRVTFDKNIRAAASDRIYDSDLPMTPLLREPVMVLEVKYDQVLPQFIKDAISTARLLNSSVSKYCMARELVG